ncbi:MAG: metal ABC transporter substrate-binding protein [Anaerolineales bacterium]
MKLPPRSHLTLLCAQLAVLLAACGSGLPADDPGKLNVVATVSPITNIVFNVGGDRIELVGIVPEGVNSHTFAPTPSDAQALARADRVFINGLHLEQPTLALALANLKPGAEIISLGDLTIDEEEYVFDFSFPRDAGSPNPHLWPNPVYALHYAEIVLAALIDADPVNADYYTANYEVFAARLQALDKAITATVESIPLENRKLLTYHDSWAYFAPRYGMTVVGAIQPSDFSEPSAHDVIDLIEQVRAESVPAIFGSEVFPSPVLEQIARETGAAFVDDLADDDLPGEPGDMQHSYVGLMVHNLGVMARSLGGDPTLIAGVDVRNIPGSDAAVAQRQ